MPIAFVGSEFLVNSTTASDQVDPHISLLSDGRIVVTYDSYDSPGDGTLVPCVRARILDPASPGSAPNDFIVETTTAGQQFDNEVTALGNDHFFVTWHSGDTTDIRGRIFDAASPGTAANDFLINTTTDSFQYQPSTTLLSDGRFVVTWRTLDSGDSDGGIRARIFDASGNPAANDFLVNTTLDGSQETPAITALPSGGFVAAWLSSDAESGFTSCIRARIFDASGNAGDDFVVSTTPTDLSPTPPSIAVLADGHFMVVWESTDLDSGLGDSLDGDGTCIRGRLFTANGTAVGTEDFIVNSTAEGDQQQASVTALADGRFVVMWNSHDSEEGIGNGDCVRGRIFNADGTANGADFILDTTPGGTQANPHAVALADGRFVVVWDSGDGQEVSSTFAIRGQVFDPKIFTGTSGDDVWKGGSLADQITGGLGADTLSGLAGNDNIDGGDGADTLSGGLGKDILTGGADADTFNFDLKAETPKGAGRDVITDFEHGLDTIDLLDIDAKSGVSGNQAFHWIGGQHFHHKKGELHFVKHDLAGTANDKTIVEGDINGDGKADFQIELAGLHTLTKADFVL